MSLTNSTMLALGTLLPSFDLEVLQKPSSDKAVHANTRSISSTCLLHQPVLLMVLCAHCPFVKHVEKQLSQIDQDYGSKVQIFAIASNSLLTHPQDGPEQLAQQALKNGWKFPYLLDTDQSLVKALKAACTPDFFLFSPFKDGQQKLNYRGQLDSSRPGNNIQPNGVDLRQAMDALLSGQEVEPVQNPSIGCNIKWHPGEEPSWFG